MRQKLINPEIQNPIWDLTQEAFKTFAESHPDEMQRIIEKCLANKAQREQRRYGR
jgi:DNA gyrase/topoisomerase IV subunit B